MNARPLPTPITCDQARAIDRRAMDEFGMPSLVLMENAGRGCVDELAARGIEGRVVIACGKGNNGGDGLVMARHLDNRGVAVDVFLCGDAGTMAPDATVNLNIVARSGVHVRTVASADDLGVFESAVARADWVIDALLGTGARGALRFPMNEMVLAINRSDARRMAIDLPTGLDGDSGIPAAPTVRAEVTCTFVAPKTGLVADAARPYVGELVVVDIGVPRGIAGG